LTSRSTFDRELNDLKQDILRMASLVERSLFLALDSLLSGDPVAAREVITGDDAIDNLQDDIENQCIKLIATQQPMARDLRVIITGIKIMINLERMGDHAVDIARSAMCVCGQMPQKPLEKIPHMARLVQQMVKEGMDAYVHNDVEKARQMCMTDDEVDELYNLTFQDLISYMEEHPQSIGCVVYLLMVARYLERIADRATNIAEDVIYLVTGERQCLN